VIAGSGLFEAMPFRPEEWSFDGEPLTSFEAKYLARGRDPHRAAYLRAAAPAPPPEPWVNRKPRGAPLAETLLVPRRGRRRTR